MTKIISVASHKGGTGKTTTTYNLGAALHEAGKKVLLIDLDSQANLSFYLGYDYDGKPTISDLMNLTASGRILEAHSDFEDAVRTSTDGIDYIPATAALSNTADALSAVMGRETVLKRTLALDGYPNDFTSMVSNWDYVLLDCPPAINIILINALAASDSYFVPLQTQVFAYDGMQQLFDTCKQVKELLNGKLHLEGIFYSMCEHSAMSDSVADAASSTYGDAVFNTRIYRLKDAGESVYKRQSLLNSKRLGPKYRELAAELLSRMEGQTNGNA